MTVDNLGVWGTGDIPNDDATILKLIFLCNKVGGTFVQTREKI